MKAINLNSKKHGQHYTIVDDSDFEWLNQWKWHVVINHKKGTKYATRREGGKTIYMHRILLGLTDTKKLTDHIDRNGLNNQRNNLRVASFSENNCNKAGEKMSSSKFKGVSWCAFTKKWRVRLKADGKTHRLTRFENEEDAAAAYNKLAREFHGAFAYLN